MLLQESGLPQMGSATDLAVGSDMRQGEHCCQWLVIGWKGYTTQNTKLQQLCSFRSTITYIHTYRQAFIQTDSHTYIHTYIHICMLTFFIFFFYVFTSMHACIDTYMHTYLHQDLPRGRVSTPLSRHNRIW